MCQAPGRKVLINENRDVVANIEDEPDREKTDDAVDVGLKKNPQDVAVEQFHEMNFEMLISDFRTSLPRRRAQAAALCDRLAGKQIPNLQLANPNNS